MREKSTNLKKLPPMWNAQEHRVAESSALTNHHGAKRLASPHRPAQTLTLKRWSFGLNNN